MTAAYTLSQYVCFFFVYSILGWCVEVAFAAVNTCLLYTSQPGIPPSDLLFGHERADAAGDLPARF